jgi:hypothetical protein
LIETPEERRAKQVADALREADQIDPESLNETTPPVSYVLIPADASKPLQELSFRPRAYKTGDSLAEHLKRAFSSDGKEVDLSLLQATTQLGSGDGPTTVSQKALQQVAKQGSVETFSLVHATPSNKFIGVNIYLDEVGMLKRLPLNSRASDFAARAGFNPPPQFYGDVFVGRIQTQPFLQNVSLKLGIDTAPDAPWLQRATAENLQYQQELNRITGRSDTQPKIAGGDGQAKEENGYFWTQTEEELEVVVPVNAAVLSKEIQVKFRTQSIQVLCRKELLASVDLFERIDPDCCTWTLEKKGAESQSLVVTMGKHESALWPRIAF